MNNRTGFTLLELACTLCILALLLLMATPAWKHTRDSLATRAARDHVLHAVALTRALATVHGGAELVLERDPAVLVIRTRAREHERTSLADRFRVRLEVTGTALPSVTLRFDALGIGRFANRTIRVSRGAALAGVSLSMYGRPRPW